MIGRSQPRWWDALLLLPSLLVLQQSVTSLKDQGVASGGPMDNAAAYPLLLAGLLALMVIIDFVVGLFRVSTEGEDKRSRIQNGGKLLLIGSLFVGYLIVLPYLGYHLASPLLGFFMLRILGAGWKASILMAIVQSLLLAVLFEALLKLVLPVGFLGLTLSR